jgi:hypothetical protein
MSYKTISLPSRPHIVSAISFVLFGLMFVWSIIGTMALRNALILLLLGMIPFAGIDTQTLKRCMTRAPVLLLLALTCWIVFHNQILAWDTGRAWHESRQWFRSMLCLGLGAALGCAPRSSLASLRWRFWAGSIGAAWALHLILNVGLKNWNSQSLAADLQAATAIGSRDMISYLGTGLLALLLGDAVARATTREGVLPFSSRWLWAGIFATTVLTAATMARNSIMVMALELFIAMAVLIGSSGDRRQRSRRSLLALTVVVLVSATAMANFRLDDRWKNFSDSARIAWDIERNSWWIDQVANPQPSNAEGIPVDHSAYNRIAWIRGASHLITEYPLGTGYDRNAFRRALMKHYGAGSTASGHAHAGLFDFTLATGLPGGLLFIAALLASIAYGWKRWRTTHDAACLTLVIFIAGYLLRAAVDGIVRDHMLEQAMFMTGLLLVAATSASASADEATTA